MDSVHLNSESSNIHAVLFPFMSKGHTIPILHLARLLLHRHISVTVLTTPANLPFISTSLSDTASSVLSLPFPENIPDIPSGIESTDKLPSMSLFVPFANATKLMQPHFEQTLNSLPNITFLVSDGFLGWTLDSATKLGLPRLVYYGMNNYAGSISRDAVNNQLISKPISDDEPFTLTSFPWIKLTRNDFGPPFSDPEPKGPYFEFVVEAAISTSKSYGLLVNSFYDLEPKFVDYWNSHSQPKAWCIGPLCLAQELKHKSEPKPKWIDWLDRKQEQGSSVLYVAFGSQAEISEAQLHEIAVGLEKSMVNFLWVMKKKEEELGNGFEERVRERGLIVREWVDQREILGHESVKGFLSHCGWNSAVESLCAEVPILAWPMMAEQHLNARMVVEEIKVGMRVETCDGSVRGFVKWEGLEKMVRELMEGEKGKMVRKKVVEVGQAAKRAMEEGGSSWKELNELINELHGIRPLAH
ncbi:UDP-glycosyltransferase 90A1-like [Cornus florida]|uniref:UDP-glycosyltransferase 90A1-like n=1 Tax=Cornus florida TaxID=4283 RepID=UPI0028980066|nr:UDP-glycosyltransferase 90A1-like [Cornus florida]